MNQKTMETIIYETDGPIARIVMKTPEKANVQTAQQVWDFEDALRWADRDEDIKVLIIKAHGRGFCAGHAIVEPGQMAEVYPTTGPTPERTHKNHNQDLFLWPPLRLWEFPKATIAQIHGYCLGGGTVYGYLTDLSIASDDAYFRMPLPQGFGRPGAQTLMEPWVLMNWKKAYQYLYLGQTLSADEAKEWGFIPSGPASGPVSSRPTRPRRPARTSGATHPDDVTDACGHRGECWSGWPQRARAGGVHQPGRPPRRPVRRLGCSNGAWSRSGPRCPRAGVPS